MKDFTLSFSSLKECKLKLNQLFTDNPQGKFRLSVVKWTKKRSSCSNRQIHLWFSQIAKHLGYMTETKTDGYIKNSCKIMFGIDILLSSETRPAQSVIRTLERVDYWSMDYATKLDVVNGLTVTSIFTSSEMKVFLEQMIFYWNNEDIPIKFKDE